MLDICHVRHCAALVIIQRSILKKIMFIFEKCLTLNRKQTCTSFSSSVSMEAVKPAGFVISCKENHGIVALLCSYDSQIRYSEYTPRNSLCKRQSRHALKEEAHL